MPGSARVFRAMHTAELFDRRPRALALFQIERLRGLCLGVAQDAQQQVGTAVALQHRTRESGGQHGGQTGVLGEHADFQFAQIAVVETVPK